jgi:transcriptional regulator with XRE-family HTH domain
MTDMDVYRALGAAAAKRRKQLKLTQAYVAAGIGLTRASLANIETGRQKVLLHQVYRLANVLKLDSILDLVPATFTVDAGLAEALPFKSAKVTPAQKQQVENLVRLALASDQPKRKGKA